MTEDWKFIMSLGLAYLLMYAVPVLLGLKLSHGIGRFWPDRFTGGYVPVQMIFGAMTLAAIPLTLYLLGAVVILLGGDPG